MDSVLRYFPDFRYSPVTGYAMHPIRLLLHLRAFEVSTSIIITMMTVIETIQLHE